MRDDFNAVVEQDGPWFIAHCVEVPGANGQGVTREECLANLRRAVALIREHRRLRLRHQAIAFAAVWFFALMMTAIFPRFLPPGPGWTAAITILPLALLALFATGGLGALYFLVRSRH